MHNRHKPLKISPAQDSEPSEPSDDALDGVPVSFGGDNSDENESDESSDEPESDTSGDGSLEENKDDKNEPQETNEEQESESGASDDKDNSKEEEKQDSDDELTGYEDYDNPDDFDNPNDESNEEEPKSDPYEDLLTCMQSSQHEIPENILEEFRQAVSLDREDITQDLRDELAQQIQLPRQEHSNIIMEKAAESVVLLKQDEMSRLVNQLFEFRRRRHTRWSRGVEDGSLSQSRLHRAGYDTSHIYERKEIKDKLDLGVCLLVDASSSVSGSSWSIIEKVVDSLALALEHKKGIKVCAIAYQTNYDISYDRNVQLTRLYESGNSTIGRHKADGNTPTVSALLATPMIMNRLLGHPRDKLIIHVTDGAAGDESYMMCTVKEAVDIIRKKYGLDIYCFGVGLDTSPGRYLDKFKTDYGTSFTALNTYEQLPEALKNLLRDVLVK